MTPQEQISTQILTGASTERRIDDALIAEITQKTVDAFHPRCSILFGSQARGDYHEDCGIDLFVEMESTEKPYERRVRVAELFLDRWWPMDIIAYTPMRVDGERIHMPPTYQIF